MTSRPALIFILCALPLLAPAVRGYCADTDIGATLLLQRQQQMDEANLSTALGISDTQAANLDSRQRLQLQQLELQQRMQQQQLERQQMRQSDRTSDLLNSQPLAHGDMHDATEQRRLSRERERQLSQFDWERQQLLRQFQWDRQQESQSYRLAPPMFTLH